jgi:hypothetical protein
MVGDAASIGSTSQSAAVLFNIRTREMYSNDYLFPNYSVSIVSYKFRIMQETECVMFFVRTTSTLASHERNLLLCLWYTIDDDGLKYVPIVIHIQWKEYLTNSVMREFCRPRSTCEVYGTKMRSPPPLCR